MLFRSETSSPSAECRCHPKQQDFPFRLVSSPPLPLYSTTSTTYLSSLHPLFYKKNPLPPTNGAPATPGLAARLPPRIQTTVGIFRDFKHRHTDTHKCSLVNSVHTHANTLSSSSPPLFNFNEKEPSQSARLPSLVRVYYASTKVEAMFGIAYGKVVTTICVRHLDLPSTRPSCTREASRQSTQQRLFMRE